MSSTLRKVEHRERHRITMLRTCWSGAPMFYTTHPWPRTVMGASWRSAVAASGRELDARALAFGVKREREETDHDVIDRVTAAYLALPPEKRG